MHPILILSFLLCMLSTIAQAANSTPNGKRGLARVMQFAEINEYNNNGLDKRDSRGTW